MKHPSLILALAGLGLCAGSLAHGSVIVTYAENPGQEVSSLKDTAVYDFNKLPLGLNSKVKWDGVGSFDRLYVLKPDQYGGAIDATHPGGTNYSVQGVGTSVKTSTLTLGQDSSYFGFWWSAGDASNVLDFYNNGKLIGEFTTANLLSTLDTSYNGNPRNRSLDGREPFAFINFYGDANTSWDQIVFRNSSSSGFESDNYTSRISTYNPLIDGATLPGIALVRLDNNVVTKLAPKAIGAELWGSKSAIPGAPEPSVALVAAFGAAMVLKTRKSGSKGASPVALPTNA